MRAKVFVCATMLVALCGCVNIKQASAPSSMLTAYEGKPFTAVTHKKPDFAAMTWGRVGLIGGVLGAAVEISEGNAVIRDNEVPDPATVIAAQLSADLATRMKTAPVTVLADQPSDDAKVVKAAGNTGLVLDVETINWMFLYFPFDWTHYKVMYTGRARLIDAATGKEVALVPCLWNSGDKDPPNYDQLLENKAARLKSMLEAATQTCAATYTGKMFAQ